MDVFDVFLQKLEEQYARIDERWRRERARELEVPEDGRQEVREEAAKIEVQLDALGEVLDCARAAAAKKTK